MSGLRRAFLALVPPPEVLDAVEALLERPQSGRFRWTGREQWHVTLQFYGRVGDADELVGRVRDALAGAAPVTARLRGGGAFPTPRKAQVLWLGLDDGGALQPVHAAVVAASGPLVHPRDRVGFVGHLTLARLTRPTDLRADVEALAGVPVGPAWEVFEAVLFESETRREGAVHHEQARIPFGG